MLVARRVSPPVLHDYHGRCRRRSICPLRGQMRDDVLNTPHYAKNCRVLGWWFGYLGTVAADARVRSIGPRPAARRRQEARLQLLYVRARQLGKEHAVADGK